MTFRGAGRTAWQWLRSGLYAIYPLVPVWSANREIRGQTEQRAGGDAIEALREAGLGLDEPARAELVTVFADDVARLRRLEDKLSGQMATVALLSGVASVVGGAAVSQRSVSALLLVGGSFVWLVSAGLLVLEGSRAMRLYLPDPVAAVEGGDLELPRRLAVDRLQALSLNAPRGWQLNNALFAVQRSLAVAVVLLIASGIVTTAQQFAHGK